MVRKGVYLYTHMNWCVTHIEPVTFAIIPTVLYAVSNPLLLFVYLKIDTIFFNHISSSLLWRMRHTVRYAPTFQMNVSTIIHDITAQNPVSTFGCILISYSVVADYAV